MKQSEQSKGFTAPLGKRIKLGVSIALCTAIWTVSTTMADAKTSVPAPVKVSIINTEGKQIGQAELSEQNNQVLIRLEATGLTPGVHAIHIHEKPICEAPAFTSAGAHFNPAHKQHGFDNPKGFHAGDLPNIKVDKDGRVQANITTGYVTLQPGKSNSLTNGASLIIHAKADDYKTDPSGNSGDRIACGVIQY